ncbi:hypothetical protein HBH56_189840 [Parastagonospora nodorum]|nr:hypothetical protein HBH56_189840 [Parastagonospora nodorum]KAH3925030.1 hypothetical protein HBH54_185650 [Parastagonospora nodorum]KAH3954219.1 hypothetical protein HBH53_025000 [Parastagonospora nodorum]KAH3963714.1 hypothetical protein HBH51_164840 [Parastagonospora nodorum]KAH4131725.1 hypothetical protein HBH45_189640 [Parastagonospora nodorum]
MANADEHQIEDDDVEGTANPSDTSTVSASLYVENNGSTTHAPTPAPTSVGETDPNNVQPCPDSHVSFARLDQAVSEHQRAASEWVYQMDHKEGHYYFMFAESDPAGFYLEAAGDPEALAAARNYEFALPPHPATYLAARSAYHSAVIEYHKAQDEVEAEIEAKKAAIREWGRKRVDAINLARHRRTDPKRIIINSALEDVDSIQYLQ